jgi:hypothetical protein
LKQDDYSECSKQLHVLLVALWPASAIAASRLIDPASIPASTWAWVVGLSVLGFLISSAEDLFAWRDGGTARDLGKIVSRLAGSIGAGLLAYFGALVVDLQQLVALMSVTPAAYAGEAYIRKIAERKADADASAADPKRP